MERRSTSSTVPLALASLARAFFRISLTSKPGTMTLQVFAASKMSYEASPCEHEQQRSNHRKTFWKPSRTHKILHDFKGPWFHSFSGGFHSFWGGFHGVFTVFSRCFHALGFCKIFSSFVGLKQDTTYFFPRTSPALAQPLYATHVFACTLRGFPHSLEGSLLPARQLACYMT